MPRGVRLLFAVVLLAGLTTAASGSPVTSRAAVEPDWTHPPGYFNASYGYARIVTNDAVFGGTQVNSASPISTPYPGPTTEEYEGVTLEGLWKADCEPVDEQRAKFTRTVLLPGTPRETQVSLWAHTISGKKPPLRFIKVKVNGTVLHEERRSFEDPLPTQQTRSMVTVPALGFLYGENTITVVAEKKETKRSAGWCTGDHRWGVAMELLANFTADMGAVIAHGTQTSANGEFLPTTITNNGPTYLFGLGNQFVFTAWSDDVTFEFVQSDPYEAMPDCSQQKSGNRIDLICPVRNLAPGETIDFKVLLAHSTVTKDSNIKFSYWTPGYFEPNETLVDNGEGYAATGKPERTITIKPITEPSPSPS